MTIQNNNVLITGGAGYIGSHVVRQLAENGNHLFILDDLSTGFKKNILAGKLIIGNTGDRDLVSKVLKEHRINAVLHFAAHIVVPESVSNPLKYYLNNTANARNLLQCCVENNVSHFIFSSTAAVYGIPNTPICKESMPLCPINPYGRSKLMTEWMLQDLANSCQLKFVILRYFNVAGADLQGRIGQSTPEATHLIKVGCQTALGLRNHIDIFGTDYPTEDGTCVRDYIHVEDLARAHIQALDYLRQDGGSATLNCGYGHGYSVREVLKMIEQVSSKPLSIIESERRPGDPPSLTACNDNIKKTLHWTPKYDDLELIVKTALAWEEKINNSC